MFKNKEQMINIINYMFIFLSLLIFSYMITTLIVNGEFRFLGHISLHHNKTEYHVNANEYSFVDVVEDENGMLTTLSGDSYIYIFPVEEMYIQNIVIRYHAAKEDCFAGRLYYVRADGGTWCEEDSIGFEYTDGEATIRMPEDSKISAFRIDFDEPAGTELFVIDSVDTYRYNKALPYFIVVCIVITILFLFLLKSRENHNLLGKIQLIYDIILQLFLFLIMGILMEMAYENSFLDLPIKHIICYLLVLVLLWLLLECLINNTKVVNYIFIVFIGVFALINGYICYVKSVPVRPQDITSAYTALLVASGYDIVFTSAMKSALLVLILALLMYIPTRSYKIKSKKARISSLSYLLVFGGILAFFLKSDYLYNKMGLYAGYWSSLADYKEQGYVLGLLADWKKQQLSEPENYSEELAKSILEQYPDDDGNYRKPNVIAVMNESFADMSVVGEFKTDKEYLTNWYNYTDNTIHGNLYVSIWGGITADTEFEFLTGNSTTFLPNVGYSYVKEDASSLVSEFKQRGYYTIGMHPYGESGYNRSTVYKRFGFDKIMFQDDFEIEDDDYVRIYVSDECDYRNVIKQYEEADKPVFIMNVTMQNHGDYKSGMEDVNILGSADYPLAEEYLSVLKLSDEALAGLIDYFSKVDEDTIIVIFGDHQPAIEQSFYDYLYGKDETSLSLEERQRKYQTPFMIWANYDIEEATNVKLSANYLSSYVMNVAGMEMPAYNRYLYSLYEDVPVINVCGYMDRDGVYYAPDEESEYTDRMKEYQIVQYYNMFGK